VTQTPKCLDHGEKLWNSIVSLAPNYTIRLTSKKYMLRKLQMKVGSCPRENLTTNYQKTLWQETFILCISTPVCMFIVFAADRKKLFDRNAFYRCLVNSVNIILATQTIAL
jgi:hypothetical protein